MISSSNFFTVSELLNSSACCNNLSWWVFSSKGVFDSFLSSTLHLVRSLLHWFSLFCICLHVSCVGILLFHASWITCSSFLSLIQLVSNLKSLVFLNSMLLGSTVEMRIGWWSDLVQGRTSIFWLPIFSVYCLVPTTLSYLNLVNVASECPVFLMYFIPLQPMSNNPLDSSATLKSLICLFGCNWPPYFSSWKVILLKSLSMHQKILASSSILDSRFHDSYIWLMTTLP